MFKFTQRTFTALLFLMLTSAVFANNDFDQQRIDKTDLYNKNGLNLNWINLTDEQCIDNLVACELRIQEFKWSKNIWPKENKNTKPTFSEIADIDVTRKKVIEVLRKQAVLEERFNLKISQEMLQYELGRMARGTRDPIRLKKLFELLNNNATTISECISRPYFVQSKLNNQFSNNSKIHKKVKSKATSELKQYIQSNNSDDTNAQIYTVNYNLKNDTYEAKQDQSPKDLSQAINIDLNEYEFLHKLQELEKPKMC